MDRENITKYGKADRPRSRQTGGGGQLWSTVEYPSSCPKQNRQPEETKQRYLSRCGLAHRDKLGWVPPPLILSSGRRQGTERTPTAEGVKRKACVKAVLTAADLQCGVQPDLCSIDQPPRIEQTEAMLVAVVETSSIHLPVCTVISLLNNDRHIIHTHKQHPKGIINKNGTPSDFQASRHQWNVPLI